MLLEAPVVKSHARTRHRPQSVPADLADFVRTVVRHERAQRRRRGKRHDGAEPAKSRTVVYIADLRVRPA